MDDLPESSEFGMELLTKGAVGSTATSNAVPLEGGAAPFASPMSNFYMTVRSSFSAPLPLALLLPLLPRFRFRR